MRVGLDTVTVSVPVDDADLTGLVGAVTTWTQDHERGETAGQIDGSQTFGELPCGMQARSQGTHGQGLRLVVSGSLPKAAYGHNVRAVDPVEAVGLLDEVVRREVGEVAEGLRWGDARFSRLDTVTDLACDEREMGPVLRAYESVPRRRGVVVNPLRSSSDRIETLWVRNKSGGMRLYDNLRDKLAKGAPDWAVGASRSALRAEGQQGRKWLEAGGLRVLENLQGFPDNVLTLHRRRVAWAGLDREVVTVRTWVEDLYEYCQAAGISETRRRRTMGFLLDAAVGLPQSGAKATLADCRRIAKGAGVHPSDVLPASTEVRYRLDFEGGRVERVAA